MAGDWIKFEVITSDKPEVWAIATALGIDPDAVVGKLLRVWSWFDQYTEDGNAPSVTKLLLDRNVGVPNFCDAVIRERWMYDVNGLLSLPHFDRHNGETAKTRALTAKRVAKFKAKNGNGAGVTFPLPKEEKRREDNNKTKKGDRPPITAFVKPTLTDLIDAFNARVPDPLAEAHAFLDYYESNGWKVGKNAMKSWQATVRRWIAQRNKTQPDNRNAKAGKTLEHLADRSWAEK